MLPCGRFRQGSVTRDEGGLTLNTSDPLTLMVRDVQEMSLRDRLQDDPQLTARATEEGVQMALEIAASHAMDGEGAQPSQPSE